MWADWVMIPGLQAAIKRLQLDYVDLVFCHRPDIEVPIEETVRAMNWLIDQVRPVHRAILHVP